MLSPSPFLIGVAGPSCSGKSELSKWLARELDAAILATDAYYRPLDGLAWEERARANFDEPAAIDDGLLAAQLQALARGEPIERPVYDFAQHTRKRETERLEPRPFLIVEGLFALYWEAVRRLLGAAVFIHASDDLCLTRRLERDVRERGRTPESVREQYARTVRPMAERYVLPTRAHAPLVVDGAAPIAVSGAQVLELLACRAPGPLAACAAGR